MTIEFDRKEDEKFYEEVVNIMLQYQRILKNHHYKLMNLFRDIKTLMIFCVVFLAIYVVRMFFRGPDIAGAIVVVGMGLILLYCMKYFQTINTSKKNLMSSNNTTKLTLDENGIELNNTDSLSFKADWDHIALVRIEKLNLAFITSAELNAVIAIPKEYGNQIVQWMQENQPQIEIVSA